MTQEQHTPADWMISNVRDVIGASGQQVKETSKASLDASRAAICRALSNANVFDAAGGAKPRKATNV